MKLLIPAYSPNVAQKALTTLGEGHIVVLNPNSGPGEKLDPEWKKVFNKQSEATKLAYLDLMAFPGDGIIRVSKKRPKTSSELAFEIELYKTFYTHKGGFFFDDYNTSTQALATVGIVNPGCPEFWPNGRKQVVWEGPDFLASNIKSALARNIVIALDCPLRELKDSFKKAKEGGASHFYAHHQGDKWQKGQTCYNNLPAYWETLIELAS